MNSFNNSSRFCIKCGAKINDGDLFCTKCGNKLEISDENNEFSLAKKMLTAIQKISLKKLLIIAGIAIVFIVLLVCLLGNNYKLEMDYTEGNIKHFIKGIASHGDSLDIEIEEINIHDKRSATAYLYVKYSFYDAQDIRIHFEYGHDSWDENGYLVEVRGSGDSFSDDDRTVAAVAEAIELMLTGKTKVQQNFDQHFGESYETYRYKVGPYYCACTYSVMMGNNFYYFITTHPMPTNS